MKLNNIPLSKSGKRRRKRLGSGKGSGLGKTCGRGHKGSGARSGYSTHPGFEGGQMPLYRKLPRRGFNNKNFRTEYTIVNVGDLQEFDEDSFNIETLIKLGAIGRRTVRLKILGNGELKRAIKVAADKVSESARQKIEAAGGSVELTAPKVDVEEAAS